MMMIPQSDRRTPSRRRDRSGRSERGSSLVEITVAAGIAILAIYFVAKMAALVFGAWSEGEVRMRFQEMTAQGMQRLTREVRQADETSLTISATTLRFRLPEDVDGDGTVLDSAGGTEYGAEITYSLSGEKLIREQDLDGDGLAEDDVPGERDTVASGLSAIDFQNDSLGVRVTMSLEVQAPHGGGDPRVEVVTSHIRLGNRTGGSG